MKNLPLAILFLSLFSCTIVRTVNVPKVQKDTQEVLNKAEVGIRRVEMDLADHEMILSKWKDNKSLQSFNRLKSQQQNLLQSYVRLKEDFANKQFAKSKLTSKDPEFAAFNAQQKDFESRIEILDKQFDNYRTESNKLNAYLESKSIYKVNPNKMRTDFVSTINEAKREQLKVKNELMDYNVKLNQSALPANEQKEQKTIIQDLVKMVEKVENETFKLQRLFNATMKEINSGVKFVTPGMKAHNYLGKIQNHVQAIQTQIKEFNLKAQTLKQ